MTLDLNPAQRVAQAEFRTFAEQEIFPFADEWDRREETPLTLVQRLAERGYLGGLVPQTYGGLGMDALTWGLLCEEVGRASASILSLLTVHGMMIQSLLKWGSQAQREQWLPRLATGEAIGGFGLTEPNVGSDAKSAESVAVPEGDGYRLTAHKRWISFGQVANLLLIFAQVEGKPTAFLVERGRAGFSSQPITGMLGFRAAMLADLHIEDCWVPASHIVGRVGFGFSHVAGTALDLGRYCIAWGCVGLGQGCLDSSLAYTSERKQFGTFLKGHQLIQEMVANMLTQVRAARALCLRASVLKERGDPELIMETSIAKYFASQMAVRVAMDAVQIHGANGCSDRYPVQRHMRDAKIMEIIEGSSQMQQIIISKYGYQAHIMDRRKQRGTLAKPEQETA
jgi:glutaryl-CoA dehydrogenase (non-decarboxylating)